MGKHTERISKRVMHTQISQGYCLICGDYGPLSFDHVPPQGAITLTRVEQHHVDELIGAGKSQVKGVESPNGNKFRTICSSCNSLLGGENDDEIANVCMALTSKVKEHFEGALNPYNLVRVEVNPLRFTRAMIGHILSATTVNECKAEPNPSVYVQALQKFVLGDNSALNDTHDFYYWFYPYPKHISAKFAGFMNDGKIATLSLLSFFPLAFMITKKDEAIYPSHANKLTLQDRYMYFDLSSMALTYAEFPFHVTKGFQGVFFSDSQVIVSTPLPKKRG